jgi:predicted ArsR family transcriptional regulator
MPKNSPVPDHATSIVPLGCRRAPTGQKAAILEVIRTGPMTSEEMTARTGIRTAGARLSELLRDGYVRANGTCLSSTGRSVLIYEFAPIPQRRPNLGMALKERFGDGKWHRLSHIADKIDHGEDRVRRMLDSMLKSWTYGCKAERKKVGQHFEYRIFRLEKMISSGELIEKLTPILKGLEAEGAKNMATMSPGTVAYLAGQLRRLLEEWTE